MLYKPYERKDGQRGNPISPFLNFVEKGDKTQYELHVGWYVVSFMDIVYNESEVPSSYTLTLITGP